VSGWQEDVQRSIEQEQDGHEADGDLSWRHEPDATPRRPLWIAGDIGRPWRPPWKAKVGPQTALPEDRFSASQK
jgi:hypothetical protein